MFEILVVIAFIGLTIKFFGLAFRITWGAAKICMVVFIRVFGVKKLLRI